MIEKKMRMNYLFDFYQSLLTEKQRNYMSSYYLEDYSLGEIGEEYEVSRQAVYDNIQRTEAVLEEYEAKLKLLQKFQERAVLIEELKSITNSFSEDAREQLTSIVNKLEEVE